MSRQFIFTAQPYIHFDDCEFPKRSSASLGCALLEVADADTAQLVTEIYDREFGWGEADFVVVDARELNGVEQYYASKEIAHATDLADSIGTEYEPDGEIYLQIGVTASRLRRIAEEVAQLRCDGSIEFVDAAPDQAPDEWEEPVQSASHPGPTPDNMISPVSDIGAPRPRSKDDYKAMCLAHLSHHHEREGESCGNHEPAGCREMANSLKIDPARVSEFFKDTFEGHKNYKLACGKRTIGRDLKLMEGEYTPRELRHSLSVDVSDASFEE